MTSMSQSGFERCYDVKDLSAMDVAVLDTFPPVRSDDLSPYPGKPIEMVIATDEFSPVCPWSGLPDFGKLEIRYVPAEKCVELKRLKYDLTIICDYRVRGGIHTIVKAEYAREG